MVKLAFGVCTIAQKKYDDALKTLALVKDPAFKATADEARGDIYVAKKILSRKSLPKCMG
jgi:predicted negative regulator of RcsB-dependent stress response